MHKTEKVLIAVKDYTEQSEEILKVIPKKSVGPKRLIFDIETSPNIGVFWEAGYKKNIPYENIIKERAIMCICYKWEGEKKVHGLFWDDNQDDKTMLEAFLKIANEADELIGHNGDKFDLAWIRTRCLFHGLSMFPKYTTVDTLKIARSKFRFNSNRLDYIAKYLGIGSKIKTTFSLWRDILLDKSETAKKHMLKYCKGDVVILEKVFQELSKHIEAKQHYGVLYNQDKDTCPNCGGDNLIASKLRTTAAGTLKRQYQCKGCHKYHTKTVKTA
jgi:DNA polymerase III epsilon subunit-like protein